MLLALDCDAASGGTGEGFKGLVPTAGAGAVRGSIAGGMSWADPITRFDWNNCGQVGTWTFDSSGPDTWTENEGSLTVHYRRTLVTNSKGRLQVDVEMARVEGGTACQS